MLQEILKVIEEAEGRPLPLQAIRARLDVPKPVLEHMLQTLVRRGRLLVVDGVCQSCAPCPLRKFCDGPPPIRRTGYVLKDR